MGGAGVWQAQVTGRRPAEARGRLLSHRDVLCPGGPRRDSCVWSPGGRPEAGLLRGGLLRLSRRARNEWLRTNTVRLAESCAAATLRAPLCPLSRVVDPQGSRSFECEELHLASEELEAGLRVNDEQGNHELVADSIGPCLHAIDFFCGAGGMTSGLRRAGLQVRAGVDFDPCVKETYEANHSPAAKFVEMDVRECTGSLVESWLPVGTSPDDVVFVGCSPCQYWSRVPSAKKASLPGSRLLLEFGRLVQEFKPGYVIVENVPGIRRAGEAGVLQPFLAILREGGYAVASEIIQSAWFGVPQMRPRFLLAASRLHASISLPAHDRERRPKVREFIGSTTNFCLLQAGKSDPNDPWHRAAALSEENQRRIELTTTDGGNRTGWSQTPLQIPAYMKKDGHFTNVYGRMWWDRPGATITTRFNSLSNGRFGHPEQHRAISIREGAALQTFPRDYVFKGSVPAVCRQIGNAVPPEIGFAVGCHLQQLHATRSKIDGDQDVKFGG